MKEHTPQLLKNPNRTQRIRDCCNVLRFVDYWTWKSKLYHANFCKYDKFCLACSTRRAIKKIQHFGKGIEEYWLAKKNWYHITLTIRHNKSQTLEWNIDRIMKYKKAIALSVRNSKRPNQKKQSFFSQFDGMVSSVEVTHWKNGRHPHIHALVCTDNEIPLYYDEYLKTMTNEKLWRERKRVTVDSFSVSARKIDLSKSHFDKQGLAEVFKYAVKFSTLSTPDLVSLIELQDRKQYRFYSTTGIFRGWKFEEDKKKHKWLTSTEIRNATNLLDFEYDIGAESYSKKESKIIAPRSSIIHDKIIAEM